MPEQTLVNLAPKDLRIGDRVVDNVVANLKHYEARGVTIVVYSSATNSGPPEVKAYFNGDVINTVVRDNPLPRVVVASDGVVWVRQRGAGTTFNKLLATTTTAEYETIGSGATAEVYDRDLR